MKRKVKMFLYADPGVGKSTFAAKAPNPLFLCTDGNFEWLGLPEKNHIQLESFAHFKAVVADIIAGKYNEFDTLVLDLVEDLNTWSTREFCAGKKIEHIGDYKSFGAGYDLIRKEIFAEISKLINHDSNFIGLSHGVLKIEKDRKGTEHHKYYPHDSMSIDKLWTPLEGRVRYFLRAYMKPEEIDGKVKKVRYLSINPKENEFGIARGLDENNLPDDIKLDWDTFINTIGIAPEELIRDDHNPAKTTKTVVAKKAELPEELKSTTEVEVEKSVERSVKANTIKARPNPITVEQPKTNEKIVTDREPDLPSPYEVKVEIKEEVKPAPITKSVEVPTKESSVMGEITDDTIIGWLQQGLTVSQVETTYGIKLSQNDKIRFVRLKVKAAQK